jgi:hypothetical protein
VSSQATNLLDLLEDKGAGEGYRNGELLFIRFLALKGLRWGDSA